MKRSMHYAATALIPAFFAVSAHAAPAEDDFPYWYLGVSGGVQFLSDSDIKGTTAGEVSFDDGVVATVALGYAPHFGVRGLDDLRVEAEFGYHRSDLDSLQVGAANTALSGDATALTYMGNVFYDLGVGGGFAPYVGAGAGAASVHLSRNSGLGNTDSNDTVFAYQLMTGLSYAPESIPLTEWSIGYRFLNLNEPEFATATGSVTLDDYQAHSVEVGAKFRF